MIYQYTLRPKLTNMTPDHFDNTRGQCFYYDVFKQCFGANTRLLEHGLGSWDDESPASDQTRAENDAYAAIWLLPHDVQDYIELHITQTG